MGSCCSCFRDKALPRLPSRVPPDSTDQSAPPKLRILEPCEEASKQVGSTPHSPTKSLLEIPKRQKCVSEQDVSEAEHRRNWEVKLREVRTVQGVEQSYRQGSERLGRLVRAEHRETGKHCWLLSNFLESIQSFQKKKERIEELRACDHPHVLRVLEVLKDREQVHIVYENTVGGTAEDLVKTTGGVDEALAATIMRQVFAALRHCHTKGLVLRSLSLQHILFTEPTQSRVWVKLRVPLNDDVDFAYLAPESKDSLAGPASDIYSCGAILAHLLIGKSQSSPRELQSSYSKWNTVSRPVKSFTFALESRNYRKRPNIEECMQHPWIRTNPPKPELTPCLRKALHNMSQAKPPTPLKRALLQLMLHLVVSSEALREAEEAFSELDSDLDGTVSEAELRTQLLRLCPEEKAQLALSAITSSAVFSAGKLGYSEFLLWASSPVFHTTPHLLAAFRLLDREKDNYVTGKELREVLTVQHDDGFDLYPWRVLIAGISNSTEGHFNFTEFWNYMRK